MKRLLAIGLFLVSAVFVMADTLPAKPAAHFNDYAGVVSTEVAKALDDKLAALEKSDSTQFVVAVYPQLPEGVSLEDYTQKTAQSWQVGQKGKNNGLVLFLFANDGTGHKAIRYEVGYGMEGVFPDATAKLIIERNIVPALKRGDWNAAANAGVNAAIAQIHGEYKAPAAVQSGFGWKIYAIFVIIGIWVICLCVAPRITLELTSDILNIIICIASAGKSGSSGGGFKGGGGSFGGGGASGRA
jgi:uncharacterized protein